MDVAAFFLTLGGLFLAGLAAEYLGRRARLPRVTLLIACGLAVGPSGLAVLPETAAGWYELMAVAALTMVAFLLGGSLTRDNLRDHGRAILCISLGVVVATISTVAGGLVLLGQPLVLALVLGAIATATAPAATQAVLAESGLRGGFVDTLKGIVAIDDAWGLIAFSIVIVLAGSLAGQAETGMFAHTIREIAGSVALGAAIGAPAAILTGRIQPGEPLQAEAYGLVFLAAGLALHFDLSYLITGMTAGACIANLSRHHTRAFHEIEHIQTPFLMLFFILAGASLELARVAEIGLLGAAYVALRIAGRLLGAWLGASLGGAPQAERPWYGPALLAQAGVAVGMSLVVAERLPQFAETVLTLTIGTTVIFELIGPPATMLALRRVASSADSGLVPAGEEDADPPHFSR